MTTDRTRINAVLRSLDTASHGTDHSDGTDGTELDAAATARADALLERIVATDPRSPLATDASNVRTAPVGPMAPAAPRRPVAGRRLAWVAAGAAAIAAVSLVVPGGSGTAYASWTGTPTPVLAGDVTAVTAACRDSLTSEGTHSPLESATFDAPPAIAERRGDYVFLMFTRASAQAALAVDCVAEIRPGSGDVDEISGGAGGAVAGDAPLTAPDADAVEVTSIGEFNLDGTAASVAGRIGSDVTAVIIHAGERTVAATLSNGWFVAWWPGAAFTSPPNGPSGEGGPRATFTYDVQLADGTVRTEAPK